MTAEPFEDAADTHIVAIDLAELLDQIDDIRNELTLTDGAMKQRRIDALANIAKAISLDLADRVGRLSVQQRAAKRA